MDTDCEMNRMFARRLQKQQMQSPVPMILSEHRTSVNTTPTKRTCEQMETMSIDDNTSISQKMENKYYYYYTMPLKNNENEENIKGSFFQQNVKKHVTSIPDTDTDSEMKEIADLKDFTLKTPERFNVSNELGFDDESLPCLKHINNMTPSPSSDRYIPSRRGNDWQTKFFMIPDGRGNGATQKKSRESGGSEGNRDVVGYTSLDRIELMGAANFIEFEGQCYKRQADVLPYTCLLRNELLGANIVGVKGQCAKRQAVSSPERKNLFQYTSPYEGEQNIQSTALYSLWPVGPKSQKLLRSSLKARRKIPMIGFKVSADGYYLEKILIWKYPKPPQVDYILTDAYRLPRLAMNSDGKAIGAGGEPLRFLNILSKVSSQKVSRSVLRYYAIIR